MTTPPLNFHRAVYEGGSAAPDQCAYCGRGITSDYYRVGGHMACPVCTQQAQSLVPADEHKVFFHALSYGAAAAVLGCAAYAVIVILTGWTIGYAALGVGYMIGWAMRRAAKQHGGRRYQWAAALLTYAAVAVAFVPVAIHASLENKAATSATTQQAGPATAGTQTAPSSEAPKKAVSVSGFVLASGELLGLGLVSPFFELTSSVGGGLLNLFIIFIGVRFAWQMMAVRTITVEGPFEANAPASPSTPVSSGSKLPNL